MVTLGKDDGVEIIWWKKKQKHRAVQVEIHSQGWALGSSLDSRMDTGTIIWDGLKKYL